jgi:hypothetical protein
METIRGLYFADVGRVLPEVTPKRLVVLSREQAKEAHTTHPWWVLVRDTSSMGSYGAVFDYKWIGVAMDGVRGHAIAMLLWDRLLVLGGFHDPICSCDECIG